MSYATLNGVPVASARVLIPRVGIWHAELQVASNTAPIGKAILVLDGVSFSGTVRRSGLKDGVGECVVVGGSGGLGKVEVEALGYRGVTVRHVVQGILEEAREKLSGKASAAALDSSLELYARRKGRAGVALAVLADTLALSWRVLRDGTVWLGEESWPKASGVELVQAHPRHHFLELTISPALLPGTTFEGDRVSVVEHRLDERELATYAWVEPTP